MIELKSLLLERGGNMQFRKLCLLMVTLFLVFTISLVTTAQDTERLRVALTADESTINPYTYVSGYPGWNLLSLQYDTLYQLDMAGIPQPWLATAATTSEDGLTVTLELRDDVTWHDGEALTAEDVVFTVNYFKQYNHGRFTRALNSVASAEATGDYDVVLTLT